MYDRILVPTDGSPTATAAMEHALELARRHGATVHVLGVVDSRRYDTSIESAVDPVRERSEYDVDELLRMAIDADVAATGAVEVGRPAREILAYVTANDVDIVVIGTRGQGGLPQRLLGSVTTHVVTHAPVPVYVVPAVEDGDRNGDENED